MWFKLIDVNFFLESLKYTFKYMFEADKEKTTIHFIKPFYLFVLCTHDKICIRF